jgi:predicted ATPase
MKLAYLWIDKYINLHNCGFTFTSIVNIKNTVDFKKRSITLIIESNENYISNLFGSNITEITAIVGANGVGKSNLLDLVRQFVSTKSVYDDNWLVVLYDEKNKILEIVSAMFERRIIKDGNTIVKNIWNVEVKNLSSFKIKGPINANSKRYFSSSKGYLSGKYAENLSGNLLYYSPFLDFRSFSDIPSYVSDNNISTNYLIEHDADTEHSEYDKLLMHKYKNIERQFSFVQHNTHFVKELNLPSEVIVRFTKRSSNDEIREDDHGFRTKLFYEQFRSSASSKWSKIPNKLMHEGRNDKNSSKFNDGKKIKIKWWFVINLVTNYLYNYSYLVDLHDSKFSVSNDLREFDFENDDPIILANKFFSYHKFADKAAFNFIGFINFVCNIIDTKADVNALEEDNESWFSVSPSLAKRILDLHHSYIKIFSRRGGAKGFLHIDWRDMSSGEKAFLDLFSRIDWAIRNQKSNHKLVYLLLDEGEAGFHPLWQRRYLSYLIKFLGLFPNKVFHIILTTHSPFIVSDLPKENIILLKLNNEGKCVIENKFTLIERTFAANIHSILADSFFMEEGLIGKFATDFINTLFEQKSGSTNNDLESVLRIINIIGEPLIALKLMEKYKLLYSTLSEEEKIKLQLKRLNERLNNIQGGRNDQNQ